MASPTKKRKMNTDGSLLRTTRNLDYFFSKEKKSALLERGTKEQRLTDEELARKLSEQWNKEDTQPETRHNDTSDTLPAKGITIKGEECIPRENAKPGVLVPSSAPEAPRKANLALQPVSSAEDAISSTIPLDEDTLDFIPSKYVPGLQNHWKIEGGDSSYALLTRCFVLVNSTRSRIKIVNTLVNFLRVIIEGDPGSLLSSVSLELPLQYL
jgi:DNA ligase-1